MSRSAALRVIVLLNCSLVGAVAATAAPAPIYKPRPSEAWVTGWGKPVDPLGDCRFDRADDKLTITVPDKGHTFGTGLAGLSAPHLLREVEGDFAVEVRVGGQFSHANPKPGDMRRGAGILLTDGVNLIRFGRVVDENNGMSLSVVTRTMSGSTGDPSGVLEPTYLRVERRKDVLTVKHSKDRREWTSPFEGHPPPRSRCPSRTNCGSECSRSRWPQARSRPSSTSSP